jgi:hypothetical protein
MKLNLSYDWTCTPEQFWALYFDPDFVVRLHLEALGSTSAEVVSQEGDLQSGLVRTLRYGQKPNMPGPVRKIFGEEVVTTEVSTFDPATSTATFTMTPETFSLEAKVKIFGAGPIVERFIESQAREVQEKSVQFMRDLLES